MKITIEIDEKHIADLVEQEMAKSFVGKYVENYDFSYGVRKGTSEAVKKYVYDHKDAIIEKTVDRAAKEITRKGLPVLLERAGDSDD